MARGVHSKIVSFEFEVGRVSLSLIATLNQALASKRISAYSYLL